MSALWSWVTSHWFIVWPLVTALASIAYSLLDENTFFHSVFSALASMGIDLPKLLAMLKKLLGVTGASAAKPLVVFVLIVGFGGSQLGCLSSAPIVPVTPANQQQVSSCQTTAADHNAFVVAGFVLGGTTTTLGAVAGMLPSDQSSTKSTLAITSAVVGAVTIVDTALTGMTASNFSNSNCSSVVGSLPAAAKEGGQ